MLTSMVMAHDTPENEKKRDAAIVKLGGPAKVGRMFGVSRAAVCQWVKNGVSPEFDRAGLFCELTGLPMEVVNPRLVRRPIQRECAA
jgi:hypothetical protein